MIVKVNRIMSFTSGLLLLPRLPVFALQRICSYFYFPYFFQHSLFLCHCCVFFMFYALKWRLYVCVWVCACIFMPQSQTKVVIFCVFFYSNLYFFHSLYFVVAVVPVMVVGGSVVVVFVQLFPSIGFVACPLRMERRVKCSDFKRAVYIHKHIQSRIKVNTQNPKYI